MSSSIYAVCGNRIEWASFSPNNSPLFGGKGCTSAAQLNKLEK
jgi:hypothetical protein